MLCGAPGSLALRIRVCSAASSFSVRSSCSGGLTTSVVGSVHPEFASSSCFFFTGLSLGSASPSFLATTLTLLKKSFRTGELIKRYDSNEHCQYQWGVKVSCERCRSRNTQKHSSVVYVMLREARWCARIMPIQKECVQDRDVPKLAFSRNQKPSHRTIVLFGAGLCWHR